MDIYFAPMEGITGYIYRNAHYTFFGNIDKYFSPFIIPNQNAKLKSKGLKDVLPDNNQGLTLIPQLLTNNAKDFINTSKELKQMGYLEINLNLGCPSGTVVAKNRGAGFLAKREELNAFLEEIFTASVTKISIKTRIGKDSSEEFYDLIEIFNKYPMEELIIHPRIREDYYKNKPNLEVFRDAVMLSRNPICYNGDLFTAKEYMNFTEEFQGVNKVMIGRGLLANPGLIGEIKQGVKIDKCILKSFHDKIYGDYRSILSGDRNVLFKMKELWFYLLPIFTDYEKYAKKIKKSERLYEYDIIVSELFREQTINVNG